MKWRPTGGTDTLRLEKTIWRTRAKRGGNRSVMTKLSKEANDLLEDEPMNKERLDFIASSLNEMLKLVKTFDEEIVENCAVDGIEAEILESDEINSRVMDLLRLINEATSPKMIATQEYRLFQLRSMSAKLHPCLLYTSPSPRDLSTSRMPSSA